MRQYSVYVVELGNDPGPRLNPIKPRVYVGYTEKTPEQRFAQHKLGGRINKASPRVARYGTRLRPRLYQHLNPIDTLDEARRLEAWLARRLLKRGYTVFGGGITRADRAARKRRFQLVRL